MSVSCLAFLVNVNEREKVWMHYEKVLQNIFGRDLELHDFDQTPDSD
jgi:hypothetical protein